MRVRTGDVRGQVVVRRGGMGSGGYANPLGRASVAGPLVPPGEAGAPALARASVVGVKHSSMGPAGPGLAVSCRPHPALFAPHSISASTLS